MHGAGVVCTSAGVVCTVLGWSARCGCGLHQCWGGLHGAGVICTSAGVICTVLGWSARCGCGLHPCWGGLHGAGVVCTVWARLATLSIDHVGSPLLFGLSVFLFAIFFQAGGYLSVIDMCLYSSVGRACAS